MSSIAGSPTRSIDLASHRSPLHVWTMSTSGRFADRRTTKGVRDYFDGGDGLLESISRATHEIAGSPIHAAQTPSRASPRCSEGRSSDGHEITLPPRENADDVYETRDAKKPNTVLTPSLFFPCSSFLFLQQTRTKF